MAAGVGSKRRYQYCSDNSGTILYFRALLGHSGHNLIDPTLQDNVLIESGIFHHIYHIGCAFNRHSIINNGLIPGGQDSSRRQTVFFLPIDPRNKDHQDPEHIDFSVPRRARYVHSAWKKHQDVVFWVDINLAIKEGLTFYQTRSNAIILQGTLPAYCIPKVVRLKIGEVLHEKAYMSPRPPPKISLRHDHDWTRGNHELGSTVEQQPVGKLVQQSFGEVPRVKLSKPTQSKPKPICDRSGKPEDTEHVFVVEGETSRSHEIDEKGLHEELGSSDRSGKPERLSENIRVKHAHDGTGQLVEQSSSSTHIVKEQFVSEENRDIASFNADDEFKRAINEENIDFNRSTTFNSETVTWHQRSKFDSEDREPVLDLFFNPNFDIRKGRPYGHRYGKKEGDHEHHTANQLKKKCLKREFLSIHDRFIRDARFRKTMIELGRTEEVILEMDKLANEEHTHHATEEELNVYRSNWWIRSNFVGSDTMPIRHRADFKEALSTLRRLKNEEDQAYYQNWWQSSSSSWWNWQDSWWHPSSETSPRRWTQH